MIVKALNGYETLITTTREEYKLHDWEIITRLWCKFGGRRLKNKYHFIILAFLTEVEKEL